MSYMRGDYYLWHDEDLIHLWAADGYDEWDGSSWNEGRTGHTASDSTTPRPSGVAIPIQTMDEFVVMRFAELLEEHLITETIDRALAGPAANFGGFALKERADEIRAFVASSTRHKDGSV